MQSHGCSFILALGVALLSATSAGAAPTDAQKCEAAKLKAAGKYSFCWLKAEAKAVKTGEPADSSKCDSTLELKWGKAESSGSGMCPTNGDGTSIRIRLTSDAQDLAVLLSGGVLPPSAGCGNGIADPGESCDGSDLRGETCATYLYASGSLACTDECRLDASGCEHVAQPPRFRDNGDGTTSDLVSGLMWEQKFPFCGGCASDVNKLYSWSNSGTAFDGSVKTLFLNVLNDVAGGGANCLGGHCDWRLPTIQELASILYAPYPYCATSPYIRIPCIDGLFHSETGTISRYWTSTSVPPSNTSALAVSFYDGYLAGSTVKSAGLHARAVRGGL